MAFYESPRFSERIAMGALGGARFDTEVVAVRTGAEQRTGIWTYPMHHWDVSAGLRTQDDFQAVRAHFLSVRGRLHGWRFKDWSDFSAAHSGAEQGVVLGLTSTTFQLIKRYASGAQSLDRKILKPLSAGFSLKDSGVTLTPGVHYTLDTVTGVVTTAAPRVAANLTWAGEFDVPMRYDTDALQARIVSRSADQLLYQWEAIPIVELRTP